MNRLKSLLLIVLISLAGSGFAQDRPVHEIYSMMVYNFIKYIQWPDHNEGGEFVIGVVGNDNMFNTLNEWYGGKNKGSKTFVIKKFNSASEVSNCHLVYVDKSKTNEFESIKGKLNGQSTLIVTDRPGLAEKGSGINFKTVDNKLKFEMNQKVVESSNLKVSSALSSMAILI